MKYLNILPVFALFLLAACDSSLVDYLKDGPGTDNPGQENPGNDNPGQDNPGTDNPGADNPGSTPDPVNPAARTVYVAVSTGSDANEGWSKDSPVQTIGRALDIWAAESGYDKARIVLRESIIKSERNEAIYNNSNGMVIFDDALFNAGNRASVHDIVLEGEAGVTIEIDNSAAQRVIKIDHEGTITLKNLTITGGTASSGAGIYLTKGELVIEDGVVIEDNTASSMGGGILVSGNKAKLTMNGGRIIDNTSGNDGGGIYIDNAGKAYINNGFIGEGGHPNEADYGGGIYVGDSGELVLGQAGASDPFPYIQYNEAYGAGSLISTGGGIVINGNAASKLTFHHGTVRDNGTAKQGGGILIVHGTLDMRGGTVSNNNTSSGYGKGVTLEGNADAVCKMSENAQLYGSGNSIYLMNSGKKVTLAGDFNYTGDIAYIEGQSYYTSNVVVLEEESSGLIAAYATRFRGFGVPLQPNGAIP